MPRIDTVFYLRPEEYAEAITVLRTFTVTALSSLASRTPDHLKDQIIGNFIARGTVCLESIHRLWQVQNFQDCWILHRVLVDRMLLLRHLIDNNEFNAFERWSFQRQYRDAQNSLSDPAIRAKLSSEGLKKASAEQRERRNRFDQEPKSTWKRPDPKELAKQMNLFHMYRVGYHYPSTEVHPMADDGKKEFARLLGLPMESYGDETVVLHNSLPVPIYLSNLGFAACEVMWRAFVDEFLDQIMSLLESGSRDYLVNFQKAMNLPPHISWCEAKTKNASSN